MICVGTRLRTQTIVDILCAPTPYTQKRNFNTYLMLPKLYSAFSPTHSVHHPHPHTQRNLIHLDTLRAKTNVRYFADEILKCIFESDKCFGFQNSKVTRVCYWGSDYLTRSHAFWGDGLAPTKLWPQSITYMARANCVLEKQHSMSLGKHHRKIVRCWSECYHVVVHETWSGIHQQRLCEKHYLWSTVLLVSFGTYLCRDACQEFGTDLAKRRNTENEWAGFFFKDMCRRARKAPFSCALKRIICL